MPDKIADRDIGERVSALEALVERNAHSIIILFDRLNAEAEARVRTEANLGHLIEGLDKQTQALKELSEHLERLTGWSDHVKGGVWTILKGLAAAAALATTIGGVLAAKEVYLWLRGLAP